MEVVNPIPYQGQDLPRPSGPCNVVMGKQVASILELCSSHYTSLKLNNYYLAVKIALCASMCTRM